MAAILKLRRGTTTPSLQESELFYDTTLGTIQIGDGSTYKTFVKLTDSNIGSLQLSGIVSASSIEVSGDATIGGNIVLAGNIFLGDGSNTTDNVNINSSFSGSFIPTTDAVFTLGTDSKKYLDLRVVNATIDNINLPGSTILSSSATNFTDYSQSVDNRLDIEEAKSVTLQTVTSSFDSRLNTEEAKSLTLATVTSSYDGQLSNLEITSASHDIRLDVQEAKSLTLQTVTSSYDGRLDNLQLTSQSHDLRLDNIELTTQSLDSRVSHLETDTGSQDNRLNNLEITSASHDSRLDVEEAKSATLSTVTSSFDNRLDVEEAKSVTLETVTSSFDDRLDQIEVVTSSLISTYEEKSSGTHTLVSGSSQINADTITNFDSNVKVKLNVETVVSGSSQVNFTQLSGISNNIISSSTDTNQVDMVISGGSISANLKGGVVSGSSQINSLIIGTSFSSSLDSRLDTIEGPFSSSVDTRLDSLEGDIHTHSNKTQLDTINQNLATTSDVTFNTGSFTGNITVTGDLTVLGAATEIQTTELRITDKLITVADGAADSTAADGAGIEIGGANKSLQWDHNSTSFVLDAKVSSSVGFKGEGGELTGIDTAQVTEASNLYYTDTRVKTKLNTEGVVSGSSQVTSDLDLRYLEIGGDNVISGSSQVSSDQTTGWVVDVRTQIDNVGLISGSSQVDASSVTNFDSNVTDKLNADNVHSGSYLGTSTTTNLTEGTGLYYTDTRVKTKLDAETVVSGSSQVTGDLDSRYESIGNGIVSGSSQISSDQTTGWATDVKTQLNSNTVISGSTQVSYTGITDKPTTISGGQASAITANTAKVGITVTQANNITTNNSKVGITSAQANNITTNNSKVGYLDSLVKTKLTAETVISGSTFSSPSQGTVRATINGANTDVDTGLQTGDSPTFTTLTLSNVASGGSSDYDALFNVGGLFKKRTIGTAAFLNVSASISDDPNSIPTTKAVNDALIAAGAGDITAVNSTTTISPSTTGLIHTQEGTSDSGAFGNTGNIVIAVATGSVHFTDGIKKKLDTETILSGSITSANITDVDAFSQSGTYASLRAQSTTKADVGLGSVTNESKSTMFGSPTFTGVPISTTPADNDNSTKIATTAFVMREVSDLLGGAPAAFDTLLEISASIANGDSDVVSLTTTVGTKLAKASNLSDLSNVSTARTNLGVATTQNIGEHSTHLYYTDTRVKTKLDAEGVVSGSILNSQLANDSVTYIAGDGLTGGGSTALGSSASINVVGGDGITVNVHNIEIDSTILRKLGDSVVSGSTQVSYTGITDKPTTISAGQASAITTNTAKSTNVSTNLGITGTSGARTITSSDGTDAIIPLATTSVSGLLSPTLFDEIDVNTAKTGITSGQTSAISTNTSKNTNVSTNLSISGTSGARTIVSSDGTDAIIPLATTSVSGLLSPGLFDEIDVNTAKTGITSGQASNIVTNNNKVGYLDSLVKTKLNVETVISGSSQVIIASVNGFSAISTSLDDRLDTLEGDVHENVLTFGDTANIDLIRTTNNITANIKGGIFSGSAQIAAGGDVSGNVNSLTVEKVQGVSLTSGEATQIANIGSNTISSTQWGYVGGSNQHVKTTSNVTFASASLSNVTVSGNLTVLGTATKIETTDLVITDKLITVAQGSANSAAADGAGIEIAGANESITWNHANSRFNISDDIYITGTIKATDDVIAFSSSDRELKNNITPIPNSLEKINSIGGYSFDWNVEKQHIYKGNDYGVIAQEIEEILPELVVTRDNGYKAVKYDKLVSLLIEGIKDLSKEVEELKKKIEK